MHHSQYSTTPISHHHMLRYLDIHSPVANGAGSLTQQSCPKLACQCNSKGQVQRSCVVVSAAMSQPKLPRRPLGKTGLEASVLSFGASPLGSVFEVRCRSLCQW